MSIAKSIASSVVSSVVSSVAGVGGGAAAPTPWQLLLDDANLVMRISGDANDDGTGDVTDSQGTYNGTWTGTPTYGDPPPNIPGKALDTVSGRYVTFSQAATTGLAAWTVCGWIKPRTMFDANSPWIGALSGNTAPIMRMLAAKWQCYAWGPSGNPVSGLVTSVDVIAVDRWDHISFGYNGTTAFIHVNGVDRTGAGTVLASKVLGDNASYALRIGGGATGSSTPFNGFTSDTRIYSRALTVAESLVLATGV